MKKVSFFGGSGSQISDQGGFRRFTECGSDSKGRITKVHSLKWLDQKMQSDSVPILFK